MDDSRIPCRESGALCFYSVCLQAAGLDLKNDMRQDPAQLVEQLSTLIHGDVTKALEKCRIDKS